MRGVWRAVLVLVAAIMLMGMGGFGGSPEGTIPKMDENIQAKIIDRSGVSTDLSGFSMDGKVFLEGKRGEGQLTVFFRDLKEVSFGEVGRDDVAAELLLKSGDRLQLKVRKRAVFYGDTGYGAYRISVSDTKRIVFP